MKTVQRNFGGQPEDELEAPCDPLEKGEGFNSLLHYCSYIPTSTSPHLHDLPIYLSLYLHLYLYLYLCIYIYIYVYIISMYIYNIYVYTIICMYMQYIHISDIGELRSQG